MRTSFDVLIVGGGMVGASLAVALKDLPITIGLVEQYPFEAPKQPAYDDRAIALSYGSSQILKGMGLWPSVKAVTTPIESIHVSDRGHFGATRLSAKQQKVPALGYLVQSRDYGQLLQQALEQSNITLIQPAQVASLEERPESVSVRVMQASDDDGDVALETPLEARLLVACDGANSPTRDRLGIDVTRHDYGQVAVIANVSTEKAHHHQAFERFTEQGPIALLPMSGNRSSLVWTMNADQVDDILQLDDQAFLKALGEAFGYRLGRFVKTGSRSTFPLILTTAQSLIADRSVVIGNAAHALHPVAGQGLNLALRDIADLAEQLANAVEAQQDIAGQTVLNAYVTQRKADTSRTIRYTDSLVKIFSNDQFLLGHARAAGLMMADRLRPFRQLLAQQSMGMLHRPSRLARGLPLTKAGL